jgi:hypothetical protein
MAEIRPFEPSDLAAAATLLRGTLPDWMSDEQVPRFLTATLLDDPWADPEIPSLVAIGDDGEIIGFVGSQVRRFQFGDREVRGVCPSHLTVAADRRGGAAGALLLRRLLTSGQDFTFSDTADDTVARMWKTLGGNIDAARACDWMIVLRPMRWIRGVASAGLRRDLGREHAPVGALPFQAAGPRLLPRAFPEAEADVVGEDVDSAAIVSHLTELTRGTKLHGAYDERYLDHLFAEVEELFGPLTRRLVRRGGRAIGWYAYLVDSRSVARVLHVSASAREADSVLAELLVHARQAGVAVATGRLEPHLVVPLRRRIAVVGFARQPVIHSHDPELLAVLASDDSLLTRLDAEWFAN